MKNQLKKERKMPTAKKTNIKTENLIKKGQKSKVVEKPVIANEVKQSQKQITTKPAVSRNDVPKSISLSVPTYSLTGAKSATNLSLPKEIFAGKINEQLLKQAIRVYLNNQKSHHAHTKTRGEVSYTTAKIWKQKGTGRARHGAKSAPIFVGGGIALGPRSRNILLDLPKKMRKAALISALSQKAKEGQIMGVSGLDKATGKTKEAAQLIKKVGKRSNLVVGSTEMKTIQKAVRNLPNTKFTSGLELNTLDVVKFQNIIVTKEGLAQLEKRVKGEANA